MNLRKLLSKGRWNSGLLAIFFLLQTIGAAAGGSILMVIVCGAATYFTVSDAIDFNAGLKELGPAKEEPPKGE